MLVLYESYTNIVQIYLFILKGDGLISTTFFLNRTGSQMVHMARRFIRDETNGEDVECSILFHVKFMKYIILVNSAYFHNFVIFRPRCTQSPRFLNSVFYMMIYL